MADAGPAIAAVQPGRPKPACRAAIVKLLVWIAGVQALFWLSAMVLRPPVADPVFALHRLANITIEDARGHPVAGKRTPTYYLGAGPSAAFTAHVRITRPEHGLVVFVPRYNRHARLFVNGKLIPSADAPAWRGGRLGGRWTLPAGSLHAGVNRLSVHVERECCRAYLASIHAAPPGVLDTAIRDWRLKRIVPALAVALLGGFGALACLYLALSAIMRDLALPAFFTLTGIALGAVWQIDEFTVSSEALYIWAGQAILTLTLSGLVLLSDRWFGQPPRHDQALRVTAPVCLGLATLGALLPGGFPAMWRTVLEAAMAVAANAAILGAIVRGLRSDCRGWAADAAILLLVPVISLADVLDSLHKDPLTLNSAPLGLLALVVLLLLAIVRRGRVLFARAEQANVLLADRIAAKERELESTAEQLRQREAEAAVQAERERIMRDMHDGMGGHLLSVLMLARDERSPRRVIAETTENAIDDLRLLIDSLDSVGDSFDIALGQFRDRAETKLRAAGVTLAWANRLGPAAIGPEGRIETPGVVLTVYRILQEAVNNAVRHSGCDRLEITIDTHEGGEIQVRVTDNGQGTRTAWSAGRGLANMAERAQAIGARLAVEPRDGGTRVSLVLPKMR